jgi:hypothetical protein
VNFQQPQHSLLQLLYEKSELASKTLSQSIQSGILCNPLIASNIHVINNSLDTPYEAFTLMQSELFGLDTGCLGAQDSETE